MDKHYSKDQSSSMPKVAILILNWNGKDRTLNAINSVNELTYANKCVLVVDNGSSDGSEAAVKQQFPELSLLQTGKNLGFGGGCNRGIEYLIKYHQPDYILLVNNDLLMSADSLSQMVTEAISQNLAIVGAAIYEQTDQNPQLMAMGGGNINYFLGISKHVAESPSYITGACMLLKTSMLKHVGLFDEDIFFMYWEDADLCKRALKLGYQLGVAKSSKVYHEESASLGKQNPILIDYFNTSATIFFIKHARFWFFPVFIGVIGRSIKQLARLNIVGAWVAFFSVVKGIKVYYARNKK